MKNLAESLPIYVKIVSGIEEAILSGRLKEDSQLPSTTYISKEYGININTVNKGVNELVKLGLIYHKRGIGMFVKKGAVKKLVAARRKTFQERYVRATLVEAKRLNYTVDELQSIVKQAYEALEDND